MTELMNYNLVFDVARNQEGFLVDIGRKQKFTNCDFPNIFFQQSKVQLVVNWWFGWFVIQGVPLSQQSLS